MARDMQSRRYEGTSITLQPVEDYVYQQEGSLIQL